MRNQSTTLTNIIASSGRGAAIASILNHTTTIHHLYELLDEVKDGDDREDRDEVTVGRDTREKLKCYARGN